MDEVFIDDVPAPPLITYLTGETFTDVGVTVIPMTRRQCSAKSCWADLQKIVQWKRYTDTDAHVRVARMRYRLFFSESFLRTVLLLSCLRDVDCRMRHRWQKGRDVSAMIPEKRRKLWKRYGLSKPPVGEHPCCPEFAIRRMKSDGFGKHTRKKVRGQELSVALVYLYGRGYRSLEKKHIRIHKVKGMVFSEESRKRLLAHINAECGDQEVTPEQYERWVQKVSPMIDYYLEWEEAVGFLEDGKHMHRFAEKFDTEENGYYYTAHAFLSFMAQSSEGMSSEEAAAKFLSEFRYRSLTDDQLDEYVHSIALEKEEMAEEPPTNIHAVVPKTDVAPSGLVGTFKDSATHLLVRVVQHFRSIANLFGRQKVDEQPKPYVMPKYLLFDDKNEEKWIPVKYRGSTEEDEMEEGITLADNSICPSRIDMRTSENTELSSTTCSVTVESDSDSLESEGPISSWLLVRVPSVVRVFEIANESTGPSQLSSNPSRHWVNRLLLEPSIECCGLCGGATVFTKYLSIGKKFRMQF
jgi:Ni/Co efflux regulator RcnB